jgi:hypothetical protein
VLKTAYRCREKHKANWLECTELATPLPHRPPLPLACRQYVIQVSSTRSSPTPQRPSLSSRTLRSKSGKRDFDIDIIRGPTSDDASAKINVRAVEPQ